LSRCVLEMRKIFMNITILATSGVESRSHGLFLMDRTIEEKPSPNLERSTFAHLPPPRRCWYHRHYEISSVLIVERAADTLRANLY
jgi:hypothetical protein